MTDKHAEIRAAISRTSHFPAHRPVKVPAQHLRDLLMAHDLLRNTLGLIADTSTYPGDSTADKKLGAAIYMARLALKEGDQNR